MKGEEDKKDPKRLIVTLRHVAAPDADARISRAIDILMEAAASKETPQPTDRTNIRKETPSGQSSSGGNSRGSK
jgi:hypothetical protein